MIHIYFTTEDGAELYYDVKGPENGRPIFFLHGWSVSSALFSEQIPPLVKNGYKVILMDSRRHGKSDMDTKFVEIHKDNLLDLMLNDFKDFLKHLGLQDTKYMLVGHSAGGAISALQSTSDENVEALAIITSSYTISENPAMALLWELVPQALELLYNRYLRTGYKLLLRSRAVIYSLSLSLNQPIEKIRSWIEDILTIPKQQLILEYKQFKRHNIKENLKDVKCPTVIISAALDLITPAVMSKTMHEIIPDSELHTIQNAGHLAMIEQKEEVNEILLNFIKRKYPSNSN